MFSIPPSPLRRQATVASAATVVDLTAELERACDAAARRVIAAIVLAQRESRDLHEAPLADLIRYHASTLRGPERRLIARLGRTLLRGRLPSHGQMAAISAIRGRLARGAGR